ncbi:MAG: YhbY family RNA-binding protein [Oscillospiraceae bacterium]|nr:YhbY family RNA-binding protein [Oscillospiraceae bacterium]
MITSKQRAELRAKANEIETTLMVGKEGVTDALVEELSRQLEARELVKGKVLETALMSAREVSDQLCEALHAEGIQCVGNKFVVWRRSETLAKKTGTAKAKFKVNPVRAGAQKRRAAAKAERERRNEYFKQTAIEFAKQRRRAEQDGEK